MASNESRTIVLLALVANGFIAILKFIAASITGSAAMMAEGFHSVADTGNQLFLLRGHAASRYGPSTSFPFGRGKEIYFWSFMVAVFLFVGGAVVSFNEGLERFRHPEEPESLTISFIVLGIAFVFEYAVAFRPALKEFNRRRGTQKMWRAVRETKDPSLLVVLFEDTAALVGLLIAASGLALTSLTNDGRWDGLASMAIGVLLAFAAVVIAFEVKGMLVGEAATRSTRSEIRAAVLSVGSVESVERLLTMHMGPEEILVNLEIDFEDGLTSAEVEQAIDEIEGSVKESVPAATHIFVEVQSRP